MSLQLILALHVLTHLQDSPQPFQCLSRNIGLSPKSGACTACDMLSQRNELLKQSDTSPVPVIKMEHSSFSRLCQTQPKALMSVLRCKVWKKYSAIPYLFSEIGEISPETYIKTSRNILRTCGRLWASARSKPAANIFGQLSL